MSSRALGGTPQNRPPGEAEPPLEQASPPSVPAELSLPGLCCRTRGSFPGRVLPPEPSPGRWVGVPPCPPGGEGVPGAPFGILIPHQPREGWN